MRPSRRGQEGFTLIELLAAMLIGGLVLTALMTVFTTVLRSSNTINDRQDAAATGRLTIDRITTLLDSQVCIGVTPPVLSGAVATATTNATSVTFYADVGTTTFTPDKYRIYFDTTDNTIKQQRYAPTSTTAPYGWPNTNAATETRVLARNVSQTVVNGVTQPMFSYYGYTSAGAPTLQLSTAPTATDITRLVRIVVQFTIGTGNVSNSAARAPVQGEGYVATANPPDLTAVPPDPYGGPGCIA